MSWSASLPIYDLPELREPNAALWRVVAALFREAGIRDVPAELGGSPGGELFTQVCGYPLQTALRGRYALIGTPAYAVDGCAGPTHRSFIIVRSNATCSEPADLRGTRFVVNDHASNTGMNLARRYFARLACGAPFFAQVTSSGSHVASVAQVADGRADCAAIDCVTHAFLREFRPELVNRTRILAQTDTSPGIPFVTVDDGDHGRIAALRDALGRLCNERRFAPTLQALHIGEIWPLGENDYSILRGYERDAVAAGFPVLC